MSKVSVALSEQEQAEVQMIVVDRDEAAALRFLKEVVWPQVRDVRRKGLRGHMEAGQQ